MRSVTLSCEKTGFILVLFQWVTLEQAKHGMVHLRLYWLTLSSDYSDLKAAIEETQKLRVTSMSTSLLTIYIDSAKNLPVRTTQKTPYPTIPKTFLPILASQIFQQTRPLRRPLPGKNNRTNSRPNAYRQPGLGTRLHIPSSQPRLRHSVRQNRGPKDGPGTWKSGLQSELPGRQKRLRSQATALWVVQVWAGQQSHIVNAPQGNTEVYSFDDDVLDDCLQILKRTATEEMQADAPTNSQTLERQTSTKSTASSKEIYHFLCTNKLINHQFLFSRFIKGPSQPCSQRTVFFHPSRDQRSGRGHRRFVSAFAAVATAKYGRQRPSPQN